LASSIEERAKDFLIVGENIHATRSIRLDGKRIERSPDGREAIRFSLGGERRLMPIPERYRSTEHYRSGAVRHVAVAIEMARRGSDGGDGGGGERETAFAYLHYLAEAQVERGARWLDLNTDEVSPDPGEQRAAMEFLVSAVGSFSAVPLSIDSSNPETLRAGRGRGGRATARPMLNSAALDRPGAIELAAEIEVDVVASAAGESGIPQDIEGRRENIRKIVAALEGRGVPRERVHIDPLVFPASALPGSGAVILDCIRWIRKEYGPEIHITGGFSNASYGLPARKFLNRVMIRLAMEAGADAGIIDPVQVSPLEAAKIDMDSEAARLAVAALTSPDMMASVEFLEAAREGRIPK